MPAKRPGAPPGLVAIFFVPWVLALGWYGWHVAIWLEQSSWRQVEATIQEVSVESVPIQAIQRCSTQSSPHQAIVVYVYQVDGKRYTSRRFDYEHAGDFYCKRKEAEASARSYEKAGTVVAYYDPSNPSDAVLQPADSLWMYFFGPLLLLSGGGLVALFLRQKRRHAEANPLAL